MAPAAEGLSASSDGLRLLSKLAVLGGMGPDTRQTARRCAGKHNGRNREPSAGIIDPGISGPAVALDRRAHFRLAQPLAPIE